MMAVGFFVLICSFTFVMGKQEGFIVGGSFVQSIQKFPHVAFLTLQSDSGDEYICGSSVLNQLILITAAHCLDRIVQVIVSVGSLNRERGKLYRVVSYKQHEKWDTVKVRYDIALCKLKKPLMLSQTVKRLVLMRHPPKVRTADLAGWGATEENDYTDSIQLKHTVQKLWSHDQCRRVLKRAPKGTICGGESRAKGNFASRGDSGSGLLVYSKIIVGLVSYKDISVSRSLVVYTDVPYFYDWVAHTAKLLRCS